MFWNHFQICGVQIDEKYIVSQKNCLVENNNNQKPYILKIKTKM